MIAAGVISILFAGPVMGEDAEWIWAPGPNKTSVPQGACHFRKHFGLAKPESGEILIAADDKYELYVNGRRVGSGGSTDQLDKYDITRLLSRGKNLVAVKVSNTKGSTAALAAQVRVKDASKPMQSYSTDSSWRSSLRPLPFWYRPLYNDTRWTGAQSFGTLGQTPPWDSQPAVAAEPQMADAAVDAQANEPTEPEGDFRVEQVLDSNETGSLIALTFNEFGHVVASREDGELLLIYDSDRDKIVDKVRVYCDQVRDSQGILCLNGEVFVTGDGPDGDALYRLADKDRDGRLDDVRTLLRFDISAGDHGPHRIALGTDGRLYIAVGSGAQPKRSFDDNSPYHSYYEGDLIQPRYEVSSGHTTKVPGGTIMRVDLDGNKLQLVAGGLHNAVDLAFDNEGDLFTCDVGMKTDLGTPWYRPARVYHVIPGAEFGWRSGWAKWPDYFVDGLPGTLDVGLASPSGMAFYNHNVFPERFKNALFVADRAKGQILTVTMNRSGSSYKAESEPFLEDAHGISDLVVGPDGALYFTADGDGTGGGLYRVTWTGKPSAGAGQLGKALSAVIRQPQLDAAWARQSVASTKSEMGADWNRMLPGVALSTANPSHYRLRALIAMQLYGPVPTDTLLVKLSETEDERVRAKAAELMGIHSGVKTRKALVSLLDDADPTVRRKACEALARAGQTAPLDQLITPLGSADRFEAWAARRLLEQMPADVWRDRLLASNDHRLFIQGCVALMIADPSKHDALKVIDRVGKQMGEFVSDRNFADLLRVLQLAMVRGNVPHDEVQEIQELLAEEFPSGERTINRELVRLLAYLQVSSIMDRYLGYLTSNDVSEVEKLHLALHLRFISDGWTTDERIQLLEFLEMAQRRSTGTYAHYIMNATRDFARTMNDEQSRRVLAEGARWPNAALGALYRMPTKLDWKTFDALEKLDKDVMGLTDPAGMRLKVGIVAVLARSGDPQSMEFLRELWDLDPERRPAVAMGLAQWPDEDNWYYLMRSLPILDGLGAREVLAKLRTINLAPEEPEYYRQVILRGLALGENGADDAISLLEYWTGEKRADGAGDWKATLASWQEWYAEKWPDRSEAKLPVDRADSKWRYEDLVRHITTDEGQFGSAELGTAVFERGRCIKCHRFSDVGGGIGPDLTMVTKRLMKKQILQAILYPSHTVDGGHVKTTVTTKDGQKYSGVVSRGEDENQMIVEQEDGEIVELDGAEIDDIKTEKVSPMPDGLLDKLTLKEVSDLLAYLRSTTKKRMAKQPDLRIRK